MHDVYQALGWATMMLRKKRSSAREKITLNRLDECKTRLKQKPNAQALLLSRPQLHAGTPQLFPSHAITVLTQCAAIPSHGFRAQVTKYYVLMDNFTHISILSLLLAQMNCRFLCHYPSILFFENQFYIMLEISILYLFVDSVDGDFPFESYYL